jgi:hypothetical protein
VRKSMKTGRLEATRRERKCLHHYRSAPATAAAA